MRKRFLQGLTIVVGGLLCGMAAAQVSVSDVWVKSASEGQMATAAYMTIRATQAVRITGAESPVAGIVELHQMAMGPNDTMTMRAVPHLDLAAGQSIELKPGGLHVMLMDLSKTPLKPGDAVPVTLLHKTPDGKSGKTTVNARVQPVTARGAGTPEAGRQPHH